MIVGLLLFSAVVGIIAATGAFFLGFSLSQIALTYICAGMIAMSLGAISVAAIEKIKSRKHDC
jgi:sorbitol-specific phosphotransferase system component IIC